MAIQKRRKFQKLNLTYDESDRLAFCSSKNKKKKKKVKVNTNKREKNKRQEEKRKDAIARLEKHRSS